MTRKLTASLVSLFAALHLPFAAAAQQTAPAAPPPEAYYYRPGPWHMMWSDGYGWHGWWMFPMMLVFVLIAAAGIVLLVRSSRGRGHGDWDDPTLPALRILSERFARGEIGREEFEDKKAALLFGGRR